MHLALAEKKISSLDSSVFIEWFGLEGTLKVI